MSIFKRKYKTTLPEVVYELKEGGTYLVEYQAKAIHPDDIDNLSSYLEAKNIHVLFVANPTNHRAFEPVPATVAPPQEAQE